LPARSPIKRNRHTPVAKGFSERVQMIRKRLRESGET